MKGYYKDCIRTFLLPEINIRRRHKQVYIRTNYVIVKISSVETVGLFSLSCG